MGGMAKRRQDFAWRTGTSFANGQTITKLVLHCASCTNTVEQPRSKGNLIPEMVTKQFRRKGWEVDQHNPRNCFCPTCQKTPAAKKPNLAIVPTRSEPMQPAPSNPVLPKPTVEQKAAIRDLLDRKFDDERGCYSDGYSDQQIGREVNVPWGVVALIRDAAYGPIKTDPEAEAIRTMIRTAQSEATAAFERVAAAEKGLSAALARLDALARKYAP